MPCESTLEGRAAGELLRVLVECSSLWLCVQAKASNLTRVFANMYIHKCAYTLTHTYVCIYISIYFYIHMIYVVCCL